MTQGDQDRTIGQARREYREARRNLAVLKLRARQIGEHFMGICASLINDPGALTFGEAEFTAFTPEALHQLVNEIRDAQARVETLKQAFSDLDD